MNRKLTDEDLSVVSGVIASRLGLSFPTERWEILGKKLVSASRESGFNDMSAFIQWLSKAPLTNNHIEILASHLTVSETYFWREPQVFTALTDFVFPELIKSKKPGDRKLRIWSAGCSTGEEPYSIAIALQRTNPDIKPWTVDIIATDINTKALMKANAGIYSSWSFRNSPSWLKKSYFIHRDDDRYEIIPEIKKMVTFSCFNLNHDDYKSTICNNRKPDIIFCRNVLMYFTTDAAAKVARNLNHSLHENGWLIVASCELSSQLFPKMEPVNFPGAILYRKSRKHSAKSYSDHQLSASAFFKEEPQPVNPLQLSSSEAFFVHRNEVKVEAKEDLTSLQQHNLHGNPNTQSCTDRIPAIRSLADNGYLAEALKGCDEAISQNRLDPLLYFLRASILQDMNKNHEAVKSFKQAVYIDPDFIMGHFALGNLFILQGRILKAKQHFENVLGLLMNYTDNDIVEGSEGLSVKHIREIIDSNTQIKQV
jgi:chemotaxis protein methyltransferase CheR